MYTMNQNASAGRRAANRSVPRRLAAVLAPLCTVAAICVMTPASAGATAASATLTAGALAFINSTPSAVTLDVQDATGSGAGWNITATSTTFTAGSKTLPTTATSIATAPTDACDGTSTCTLATNSTTYPYALPAAATAPTATKMVDTAASTGMGDQTLTPTWSLAIPSSATAGAYTSTWTISLVSGP